ncbi:hypothetical protein [Caldimonas brevitalea]|uniref:Uncharacterized protein n=1 Tax=Caldimonas brevitalea TaxID=413882 RepID=A0A0G3BIN8_9BURK|nr:hypothetical protein [Caldimonas brevitalea]AKJ27833.1 hypothetical protein AAW51_1142 [Caldimonas brevitalea]
MDTDSLNPPVNLVSDFQALQMTIFEDPSGEKTRSLAEYFRQAETKSLEMQLHSSDFEEKEFARLVSDAFGASRRIVLAAWAKAHGSELTV